MTHFCCCKVQMRSAQGLDQRMSLKSSMSIAIIWNCKGPTPALGGTLPVLPSDFGGCETKLSHACFSWET